MIPSKKRYNIKPACFMKVYITPPPLPNTPCKPPSSLSGSIHGLRCSAT